MYAIVGRIHTKRKFNALKTCFYSQNRSAYFLEKREYKGWCAWIQRLYVGEVSPYAAIFYVGTFHETSLHKKYAATPSFSEVVPKPAWRRFTGWEKEEYRRACRPKIGLRDFAYTPHTKRHASFSFVSKRDFLASAKSPKYVNEIFSRAQKVQSM